MKAIVMNLHPAKEELKWCQSHFFGCVDMPEAWFKEFKDEEFLLAQLRCSEIKSSLLPSVGMLYLFMNSVSNKIHIKYLPYEEDEPNKLIRVDFNEAVDCCYDIKSEFTVDFKEVEDEGGVSGMKLFGLPASLQEGELYGPEAGHVLFFQYDPLAAGSEAFLNEIDGYLYYLIKPEDLATLKFHHVKLHTERS